MFNAESVLSCFKRFFLFINAHIYLSDVKIIGRCSVLLTEFQHTRPSEVFSYRSAKSVFRGFSCLFCVYARQLLASDICLDVALNL